MCGSLARASSRCSVETYSSPSPRASSSARLQDLDQLAPERGRGRGVAADLGEPVERLVGAPADPLRIGARAAQHGNDDAALLLEQHDEQVSGGHLRVAARARKRLRRGERLLRLDCEAICLHRKPK